MVPTKATVLFFYCNICGWMSRTSCYPSSCCFFSSGVGYQCQGDITEWTKCTNTLETPERKPFIVPQEYKEKVSLQCFYTEIQI